MKKPTLNTTDVLLLAGVMLGCLALHQKVIAPKIAGK